MTKCPKCGHEGKIVNECHCDPNNLPTKIPIAPAWKLAGMEYRSFVYSPEYWLKLTGVDPLAYPDWFIVRNGLVACTPAYLAAYAEHIADVHWNWERLGVRHG